VPTSSQRFEKKKSLGTPQLKLIDQKRMPAVAQPCLFCTDGRHDWRRQAGATEFGETCLLGLIVVMAADIHDCFKAATYLCATFFFLAAIAARPRRAGLCALRAAKKNMKNTITMIQEGWL
jgi:hypothetical protein